MTPRSIRRAAERKARKQARKAALREQATELAAAASQTILESPQTISGPASLPSSHEPQKPAVDFERLRNAAISPAQLAANRANAQLSTGPRTPAGKARSSRNAVKSGLTGQTVLLPTDDVEEYAALLAAFQRDLAPVGQAERELVQSIVDTNWRLRRIRALEFALYTHGHAQFEEAFQEHPEENRYSMTMLQTHITYEKQFRNLQIQEARLHRRHDKDMAELRRLQAERKSDAAPDESPAEPRGVHAICGPGSERVLAASAQPNGFDFSNLDFDLSEDLPATLENALSESEAA